MSTTRKFTVRTVLAILDGLPALDGHVTETTVQNPDTGEKVTTKKVTPFIFGNNGVGGGKVNWNAAKNTHILTVEQNIFTKRRDQFIDQISGGRGFIEETDLAAVAELNKRTNELLDTEIEVTGLLDIPLEALNLDGNPGLTRAVLAPLLPIISE